MFTVALLGSDAVGTRLARELVHRLPVPALHLRDGPLPDSSNRLPPASWLLRKLPAGRTAALRRLASWWYRRSGFIVILHGRAEVEGWRGGRWCSTATGPDAPTNPRSLPNDLVVVLDEPAPLPHGRTRLRSLRLGRRQQKDPGGVDALVVVLDASRPLGQLADEVERPIRSRAAHHLVPLASPPSRAHSGGRS